ncbi:MAG: hypothetical protein Kow0063_11380 [Anaerolineae bacterium]
MKSKTRQLLPWMAIWIAVLLALWLGPGVLRGTGPAHAQGPEGDGQVESTYQVYLPLIFRSGPAIEHEPDIEVTPLSLEETLAWGATVTRSLVITNRGTGALEFELTELEGPFTPMQAPAATPRETPLAPNQKVEGRLWDELATADDGQAEFLVFFREQADLRPAYAISDWDMRGEFVLRALRETAETSQAPALAQMGYFMQQGEASQVRSHYIVNALLVRGSTEVVQAMAARPEVAAIRAVRRFPVPRPIPGQERPTVLDGVEWNIAQIRADQVWREFGVRGEGIVVANIDSGVRYTHRALVNQYRGNHGGGSFDHNYNWWDPDMAYLYPTDNDGHGTHTMGTMVGDDGAGHQVGVAPGAQWIAAQGCDYGWCSDADLISAAEWILAPWDLTGDRNTADPSQRPHVVNNSWGGYGGDPWYVNYVDAWRAAGIFPAFSVGNSGDWGCGTAGSPGDYPQSFATGATDADDIIAYFSSRGPSSFGEVKPNVSAPGVDVQSASNESDNAYYIASGTSMSSPHSAGLVALMWSANAALLGQVEATADLIQDSALAISDTTCGAAGPPNNVYGWGRIDAYQALSQMSGNVSWLITEPLSGTLASHESVSVTVVLDAAAIRRPGTYRATLGITSNDPDQARINVPVSMAVPPHPNMGQIMGVVTSDRPGGTLQGALVEVAAGATGVISGTTDASGGFGPWWLMDGAYQATVTADGYLSDAQTVTISPRLTTTHQVMLVLDAPQVQVTPDAFEVVLPTGWTSNRTMTINNTGVRTLTFEITETNRALEEGLSPVAFEISGQAHVVQEDKEEHPGRGRIGAGGLLSAGGPDPFGYTFKDSNEPGGPHYEWIEIAPPAGGTGIEIPLTGMDDAYYWPITLPFDFNFYGTNYTSLAVATNGTLYFQDTYLGYDNRPIPGSNTYGVDRFIAHFWDDLVVSPGAIYYQAEADRVIVEYYQVSGLGSYDWGSWQVILFPSGNILFQYQDVSFGGSYDYGRWATVGIQGDTATGLQYSYNMPALSDGLAICFAYPGQPAGCAPYEDVTWLSEAPTSGTLPAGGSLSVEVSFDARDLSPGRYAASVVTLTDDPDQRIVSVPVTLTVQACETALLITPPDPEGYLVAGPFAVTVAISDVADLGSFEFDLAYNPDIVHVEDMSLAPFLGSTGRSVYPLGPVIDNGAGAVSFGAFSVGQAPGPDGTDAIAVMTLSPQNVGLSALDLGRAQVTDTHGQAIITCIVDNQVTISECHFADFDCDCDVDAVDVAAVSDRWGCELGEACYDPAYDVDGDGDIDTLDIALVAAYQGWTCASATWFEQPGRPALTSLATASLSPAAPVVTAGQTLAVQVVLDGAEDLGGFEFELDYNSEVMQPENIRLGDFPGGTGRQVHPLGPEIDQIAGRLRFGGFSLGDAPGVDGRGILAEITFTVQQDGDPGLRLGAAQLASVGGASQPVELSGQ